MGQIKSTLDLIMEKTKHLSLNEEEKRDFEQQQLTQLVLVPVTRYLNQERDANFLLHELERLPADKREEARRRCLDLFIDRLDPLLDHNRILAGVEAVAGRPERDRWEGILASLRDRYRERLEQARKDAEARCLEDLAQRGLRGTALLPLVNEKSPLWKEEKEKLVQAFRQDVRSAVREAQMKSK